MKGNPLSRFTVTVPAHVGERVLNAAAALDMSCAAFLQEAITGHVVNEEYRLNGGASFPQRETRLEKLRRLGALQTIPVEPR